MYPFEIDAPAPEIPYQERIFAASKELHDAYEAGEEWTKSTPLHEASVLLVMTALDDAIDAMLDRWKEGGMAGEFPDVLSLRSEMNRIVSKEGREEEARRQAELAAGG